MWCRVCRDSLRSTWLSHSAYTLDSYKTLNVEEKKTPLKHNLKIPFVTPGNCKWGANRGKRSGPERKNKGRQDWIQSVDWLTWQNAAAWRCRQAGRAGADGQWKRPDLKLQRRGGLGRPTGNTENESLKIMTAHSSPLIDDRYRAVHNAGAKFASLLQDLFRSSRKKRLFTSVQALL